MMDELPGTPKPRILDTDWCPSYQGEGVFHYHVDQFYSDEAGQLKLEGFVWSQHTRQSLTTYTRRVCEMVMW